MFRCEQCGKNIVGERVNFKVIGKRQRKYHYYIVLVSNDSGHKKQIITEDANIAHKDGNKILRETDTEGWEREGELRVCSDCFNKENA